MEMRTGRTAGRSHASDLLPAHDLLPHLCIETRQVRITCHYTVAVADIYDIAITGTLADKTDLPIGGSQNWLAIGTAKIEARMKSATIVKRIVTIHAPTAYKHEIDGPAGWAGEI